MGTHFPDFGHGLGNRASQDTAAVFGDEQVVLDADTSEVLVGLQLLVVDELLELALGLPHINEGGDEIDARLVSDHKARFQGLAAAKAAESQFGGARRDVVVTHIGLAETFHVVYVHAQHMAQAVRHEKPVGTIHQGFVHVAFHQADSLQAFNQGAAGQGVHGHIRHIGTGVCRHFHVGFQDNFVDLALALVELATHRSGAGEIGGIVVLGLGTCIAHHHAAFLEHVVMAVVVKGLSVDAEDDGE